MHFLLFQTRLRSCSGGSSWRSRSSGSGVRRKTTLRRCRTNGSTSCRVRSLNGRRTSRRGTLNALRRLRSKRPSRRTGWLPKSRGGRSRSWGKCSKVGRSKKRKQIKEISSRITLISPQGFTLDWPGKDSVWIKSQINTKCSQSLSPPTMPCRNLPTTSTRRSLKPKSTSSLSKNRFKLTSLGWRTSIGSSWKRPRNWSRGSKKLWRMRRSRIWTSSP